MERSSPDRDVFRGDCSQGLGARVRPWANGRLRGPEIFRLSGLQEVGNISDALLLRIDLNAHEKRGEGRRDIHQGLSGNYSHVSRRDGSCTNASTLVKINAAFSVVTFEPDRSPFHPLSSPEGLFF